MEGKNEEKVDLIKAEQRKKINLPNILTIVRIIMALIFVVAMALIGQWTWMKFVAFGIYVVASLTDFVDGYIARKYNLITNFGKLMDPLADKILVSAGFIMLTGMGLVPAWLTVIIVVRDFLVTTIRQFGVTGGEVIAAKMSGKVKTVCQMIGVSLCIIDSYGLFAFIQYGNKMAKTWYVLVGNVVMSLAIAMAVIMAIWSCVEYIVKYRKHIDTTK